MEVPLRRNFLVFFMLLSLVLAASAQAPTAAEFVTRIGEWLQKEDYAKVANAVRYHREIAEEAFQRVLKAHAKSPGLASEKWLNAVARAYRMEGRDDLNEELRKVGLLWPVTRWRGTMLEADEVVDTRGTVAKKLPPGSSASGGGADPFLQALAATHMAVRVGNDRALPSMFKALKAYLAKNPQRAELQQVLSLEVSALEATGQWSQALELGRQVAPQLSGAPALSAQLAMLCAARKLERPALVDRLLAETRQTLTAQPDPVGQFIVDSLATERACQSREVPLTELTRRHVEVWRNMKPELLENLPGGQGRQWIEAASVWVHESLRRMQNETEEFPDRAQLYYIVWEDLRRLRRFSRSLLAMQFQPSEASTFMRLWNPEFMLATQSLELEVVDSWRSRGELEQARLLLGEVESSVQSAWEKIREAGLGYQLASYGHPIQLEGGQFEFVWTLGEAPRMVALQRIETAYLKNDDNSVEEAIEFQKEARSQGGFLGLEDARFLKVERSLHGGVAKLPEANRLNEELEKLSQQRNYRPGRIVCLVNGAEIESKLGHTQVALAKAQEAVSLIEEYLTEVGGRTPLRERFRRAYELLAQLQLQTGRSQEAFATLGQMGQAQSLMALDASKLAAKKPQLKSLVNELQQSRVRGQALDGEQEQQARSGRKDSQLEGQIAGNRSEFYRTLGDIRRRYPDYGQMLAVRPVNFARMQQFVPKDTVVVQIFPAQDALFLFVLTRDQLKIRKVAVTQKQIDNLSRAARKGLLSSRDLAMKARAGQALQNAEPESAEASLAGLVELHRYLVDPVAEDIAPYPVVAFIPSGALLNVPLHALARQRGETLDFLIERKQVVTLLKSTDLERLARPPSSSGGACLVVGNPDGTLPAASEEARSIGALWPGSRVLLQDQATLDQVEKLAGINYLHLATHGVLNRLDPNHSYLILGRGQKLDIAEIAGLDLGRVRMVTLSACETALGENPVGQGELTTLADAFGFAGCPTVTASLWSVSDDSTRLLMEKFYAALHQGATPAAAIQTAQKFLIAQAATRHPFHWAPFTLIGDWR